MNKDDFLKEAIKAKFEFLKIYSFFLVGLVTAVFGIIFKETYSENSIFLVIFIIASITLAYVIVYFLALTIQIRTLLKQLKK